MRRLLYLALGFASLALGAAGAVLPLLPTVPFVLLAAWCFSRSSPRLERWLIEHRRFGPHIHVWRRERAVSRAGKRAAFAAFAVSAVIGIALLPLPWAAAPVLAGLIGSAWIAILPVAGDGG